MTIEEARALIRGVEWRGSRPGLSRVRELLHRIGDPQDTLQFVHIAGTNGKGSTAAMLASILRAAGYAVAGPEIISCPTCGRTQYPMIEIANEVEARLRDEGFKKPLKIAIMGCVVNGPGEASDADIGIAGGKDEALLFIRGEKIRMLKGDIVGQLLEEIHKM